jgi:subtilisin family serine protease
MLVASRHCPGVILLGFGLPGSYFVHAISNLQEGIDRAVAHGCLVVAAAGSGRADGSPLFYPAALRYVLTVAATDETGKVASFSSASPAVDLAAPGVAIPVAVPTTTDPTGYGIATGTSYRLRSSPARRPGSGRSAGR